MALLFLWMKSSVDHPSDMKMDAEGNIYIAGRTYSPDMPTSASLGTGLIPFRANRSGQSLDGFIAKFSPGGQLLAATYLGGTSAEDLTSLALDAQGNPFVTGYTESGAGYPTPYPNGCCNNAKKASLELYVAGLSKNLDRIIFSKTLASTSITVGHDLAFDPEGNIIVVGRTAAAGFPVTDSSSPVGDDDIVVAKLSHNLDGSLIYARYLGGSSKEANAAVTVDSSGNAVILARTYSANYPTTANAVQKLFGGIVDGALTILGPTGNLTYSTFLGGSDFETVKDVTLDKNDNIYVTGSTSSFANFPTTATILPHGSGNVADAFLSVFSPDGATLIYSTYFGGSNYDEGMGVAVDTNGDAFIFGNTASLNFPLVRATQPNYGGGRDAFVLRLTGLWTVGPVLPTPDYVVHAGEQLVIDLTQITGLGSNGEISLYSAPHGGYLVRDARKFYWTAPVGQEETFHDLHFKKIDGSNLSLKKFVVKVEQ